jgi:hypothetical protein
MIERTGIFLLKSLCLWLALLVGSIAASLVVPHGSFTPRVPLDGPLGMQDAVWIVNGLFALTVAALAALARFRGVRLAGFLYVTVFGTATVMMQSESLFFKDSLQINAGAVWEGVGYAAISYLVCAGVAAVLFRPEPMDAPPAHRGLIWRGGIIIVAYLITYFVFGYTLIWERADLRAFYHEGREIVPGLVLAFQVFRGALWALLALLITRSLRGSRALCALMTALAFTMFTATQLLYPNPWMPWYVRRAHLVELVCSCMLHGSLAGWLLSGPDREQRRQSVLSREAPLT